MPDLAKLSKKEAIENIRKEISSSAHLKCEFVNENIRDENRRNENLKKKKGRENAIQITEIMESIKPITEPANSGMNAQFERLFHPLDFIPFKLKRQGDNQTRHFSSLRQQGWSEKQ